MISTPTTTQMLRQQGSAIVIGGSIAGLLAARVLADHFEHVIIVERAALDTGIDARSGVPQGRHTHLLLLRGSQIMEQLLPGLLDDLQAGGAPSMEFGFDFVICTAYGWTPRQHTGLTSIGASRDLLDVTLRRRVLALPNVGVRAGYEVTGLLADASGSSVTGVRLRRRPANPGEQPGQGEELRADLVVDAGGRTSKMPDWLGELGYPRPQESVVTPFVGYATRWYRWPEGVERGWKALGILSDAPAVPRAGIVQQLERGQVGVTLMGAAKDYPPTDEAGFLQFARTLRSPLLYEAIKDAEPLTPIYGYRRTENRRVHYERMARFPERLIVLGDAACGFNPIYGQGMTVAALGAQALDEELRDQRQRCPAGDLTGLSRRYQGRLAKVITPAWMLATSEDSRYPTTEGTRATPPMRMMQWYMNRVQMVMVDQADIYRTFLDVINLIKPPTALFHPSIMTRVLGRLLWNTRRPWPTLASVEAPVP